MLVRTTLSDLLVKAEQKIDQRVEQLTAIRSVLTQLDPHTVLARGYALIRGAQKVGAMIEIETIKAIIKAEVKDVHAK